MILDHAEVGQYNVPAYDYLRAHGVDVRWASGSFHLTHEKSVVVDAQRAAVMTLNLTARYYSKTRDFVVIDTDAADVAAIEQTFDNDWTGRSTQAAPGQDLVWSPGSQASLIALIDSARHSVLVENEEMDDPTITAALASDAGRGVRVEIAMTADDSWYSAFTTLSAAGASVHVFPDSGTGLYIHAKALDVDPGYPGARAFVGSENFSVASLDYNRELGVETSEQAIVIGVEAVMRADFASAPSWR